MNPSLPLRSGTPSAVIREYGDQLRVDLETGLVELPWKMVMAAQRAEGKVLSDMEKTLLKPLNKMMPPERDFSRWTRLRYLAIRRPLKALRRMRQRTSETNDDPPAPPV